MSQYRFSNAISILSCGGTANPVPYSHYPLSKNAHLDIKFTVKITDTIMRFLPFDLIINGEELFLILPITLLDMVTPSKHV
jgi:hypothetical protein